MKQILCLIVADAHASDANGFAPFAPAPPVGRRPVSRMDTGGTGYPQQRRGSEFNQLAPQTPEQLHAPRLSAARQHRIARAPPVLQSMARHSYQSACPAQNHDFVRSSYALRGSTMSDKEKMHYTNRLSVHITPAMMQRLDQIAMLRDEARAEIVCGALRAYLDEQEDLLSSRRHFTKMFQRRVDYLERLLVIQLWINAHTLHLLAERGGQKSYPLQEVIDDAIATGIDSEGAVFTLIERAAQQKTKPPAR